MITTIYMWDDVDVEIEHRQMTLSREDQTREGALLEALMKFGNFAPDHVRDVDGVWVLDGQFDREMNAHIYMCLSDPSRAQELAEKELGADR